MIDLFAYFGVAAITDIRRDRLLATEVQRLTTSEAGPIFVPLDEGLKIFCHENPSEDFGVSRQCKPLTIAGGAAASVVVALGVTTDFGALPPEPGGASWFDLGFVDDCADLARQIAACEGQELAVLLDECLIDDDCRRLNNAEIRDAMRCSVDEGRCENGEFSGSPECAAAPCAVLAAE